MDSSVVKYLIIGAVVGLVLGVLLGMALFWGPFAVEWTDAHSYDLGPDAKAEYMALVADSFKLDKDPARADAFLYLWEPGEKQQAVADAIDAYDLAGRDDKVQTMNDLAMALAIEPLPESTPLPPTVEPPAAGVWHRLRVPCLVFLFVLLALVLALIVEDKKLVPTHIGFTANDLLVPFFDDVVNVGFTADMEEKLDRVAAGDQAWVPMLHEFYDPFAKAVGVAREKMPHAILEPEPTGDLCPQCGEPLVIKHGRFGRFIACSGWPNCRYSSQIPLPGIACPECGGSVVEKRTKRGRKFYGCANYPTCEWATWKKPKAPESAATTAAAASKGA